MVARNRFRRALGTAPRKLAFVVVLCLAAAVSCVLLSNTSQGCPRPNLDVSGEDLSGAYGKQGEAQITLRVAEKGVHADEGTFGVEGWPRDLFRLKKDGSVATGPDGEVRRFDGSGEWKYDVTTDPFDERHGRISLTFRTGAPEENLPSEDQELRVGGTPEHPLFYLKTDPDTCASAVIR
ncbi:hypothetical protein GCM10010420_38550 [Streptomyces glaucosporus]|uniref:Secreted protein n=2 Tax=Streptomyces glaucosporus TaxID=284044 RepID=A0ABN3IJT1_9ACTN